MVYKIADNITSPLGMTTEQNYQAVMAGKSALRLHNGKWGLPESFMASLFSGDDEKSLESKDMTRFESMVLHSAREALSQVKLDVTGDDVMLIISTTKGNVDQLSASPNSYEKALPGTAAQHIAAALGVKTIPVTVCNACISGASAISLAQRLIEQGAYRHIIVCGADSLSKFIVSGFQSLKAMSMDECRPFDIERLGLNLGEAAATVILSADAPQGADCWMVKRSAVRNDASHVTNPSKTAEGCFQAMQTIIEGEDMTEIAMVNAHGTATMYNDQMESIAIDRMGMHNVPVNGLKGYYGHTMGAAGILETILGMRSIDDEKIIATRGYEEIGVSGRISVAGEHLTTNKKSFIKIISGFGGCNGALLLEKGAYAEAVDNAKVNTKTTHTIRLTNESLTIDGEKLEIEGCGKSLLTYIYKRYVRDYPKFYKMDILSRLGFVASELLLQAEDKERYVECSDRAITLFNRQSSLCADIQYLSTISNAEDYFPSPADFIYTLPNIVTGEIAIRNIYHGETSFFVLPERNDEIIQKVTQATFFDKHINSVISGWIDCASADDFCAELSIIETIN